MALSLGPFLILWWLFLYKLFVITINLINHFRLDVGRWAFSI